MAKGVQSYHEFFSRGYGDIPKTRLTIGWALKPLVYKEHVLNLARCFNKEWADFEMKHWAKRNDSLFGLWISTNRGHFQDFIVYYCLDAVGLPDTRLYKDLRYIRKHLEQVCTKELGYRSYDLHHAQAIESFDMNTMVDIVQSKIRDVQRHLAQQVGANDA